jgi:hypothetical protein
LSVHVNLAIVDVGKTNLSLGFTMFIETEHTNTSSAAATQVPGNPTGTQVPEEHVDRPQTENSASRIGEHVVVHLSPEAMALLEDGAGWEGMPESADTGEEDKTNFDDPAAIFGDEDSNQNAGGLELSLPTSLTANERSKLAQLRMKDAAVRSQQFSQIAVAGSLASGTNTEFTSGPDGRLYATGGKIEVDTNPGSTPLESLSRASRLRRISSTSVAVIAAQIRQENVAVQAAQIEISARSEMNSRMLYNVTNDVEFEAEVRQRDSGAAAEAAKWNAPPEFTAQGLSSNEEAVSTTETELQGAAAVTKPEEAARPSDEPEHRDTNLYVLFDDLESSSGPNSSLEIVA